MAKGAKELRKYKSAKGVSPNNPKQKIMPKAGFSSRRVRQAEVAGCDSAMSQGVM